MHWLGCIHLDFTVKPTMLQYKRYYTLEKKGGIRISKMVEIPPHDWLR